MQRELVMIMGLAVALTCGAPAGADEAAAQKWIDQEFQPSSLSKEEQLKEMGAVIAPVLKSLRGAQAPEAQQRIDQILAVITKKKVGAAPGASLPPESH